MEVVSDGKWLFLNYCYEYTEDTKDGNTVRYGNYYSYNPDFSDTIEQIDEADYSDKSMYTPIQSEGQTPISKIYAITDMNAGKKAVEYFIRTGELYPGIDWVHLL